MNRLGLLAVAVVALIGCDDGPAPPHDLPLPGDSAAAPTAPAPSASEAASAANSGAAGPSPESLAGSWEGGYDAKKGRIDMPSGVPDPARTADDGKTAAGAGTVKITIAPDGDVTGTSQGALGAASVRGKIDGKMLRASFVPVDPLAKQAMTGVLVGIIKGDTITAELRVAGPDAVLVRQSNVELKKK